MSRDRVRTRGGFAESSVILGVREHCWDSKVHNYYGQYPTRISKFGELFRDTVGRKWLYASPGARIPAYNNAYHHTWAVSLGGTIVANCGSGGAGIIWCEYDLYARLKEALGFGLINTTVDLGEAVAGFLVPSIASPFTGHGNRWDAVRPSMSTRANLSVFLYELRDIKRMFDIIPSRHLKRRGKRLDGWGDVVREIAVYGNNAHLNFNFGWKPFVRDVVSTFRGLQSFNERLARFLLNANRELRRSKGESTSGSLVVQKTGLGAHFMAKFTGTHEVSWNSSFYFNYVVPTLSESELRYRAYLDTLGLNVTAANVWAVIPWSFVVDWFVDVGSCLDQFSSDWVQPIVNFVQAGATAKGVIDGALTLVKTSTVAGQSFPVGSLRLTYFTRSAGLPNYQFDQQTLNADKIRLLASLILSKTFLA